MGFLDKPHVFSLIFFFPYTLHAFKSFPGTALFAYPQWIPSRIVSEHLVNSLMMRQNRRDPILGYGCRKHFTALFRGTSAIQLGQRRCTRQQICTKVCRKAQGISLE